MTATAKIAGVSPSTLERSRKRMAKWDEIERRVKEGVATEVEKREFDAVDRHVRDLDPNVLVD